MVIMVTVNVGLEMVNISEIVYALITITLVNAFQQVDIKAKFSIACGTANFTAPLRESRLICV